MVEYRVDVHQCLLHPQQSSVHRSTLLPAGSHTEQTYLQQRDTEGWELVSVVNEYDMREDEEDEEGDRVPYFRAFYWKRLRRNRQTVEGQTVEVFSGDVLVLRVPASVDEKQLEAFRQAMARCFPGNKTLCLPEGIRLESVVRMPTHEDALAEQGRDYSPA